MASWDVEFTEAIGKAIPNDFAKLGGWLRYIPYVGPFLQAAGSLDSAVTSYADTKERNKDKGMSSSQATQRGLSNAFSSALSSMGGYSNPGIYGSAGKPDYDWQDYTGMASTLWNNPGFGSASNIYKRLSTDKDIDYGLQSAGPFDAFWQSPQTTLAQEPRQDYFSLG